MVSEHKYKTKCPSCQRYQIARPNAFKLAAGKLLCTQCGCLFDAKKHKVQEILLKRTIDKSSTDSSPIDKSLSQKESKKPSTTRLSLKKLTAMLLVILFLIVAMFQLSYFNRDEWASIVWLKPIYERLDFLSDLEVSEANHYRQISLSITPDLVYKNALAIRFSFTNPTELSHPLPQVQLIFTDLQGRLVSQRVFSAGEYLIHLQEITQRITPAQIIDGQLSILQSAKRGLNYQIKLLNPVFLGN
jgi:hypothetical protein